MNNSNKRKLKIIHQYAISITLVLIVSIACYIAGAFIAYKTIALLLLLTVSIVAMLFDILPVLAAAVLSALVWNFFFIPPILTFHINNADDLLMFLLYFVIALLNAVLTFKIRRAQTKARDKEEKENTIKLYSTLLNSLSHELRTPISTIVGAVDTLKTSDSRISHNNKTELLNQIDIASIRLNRQVENLLNMSRLETGMLKLNLDWCDLNELINAVIQTFSARKSHQIIFTANEHLPLIMIDRGLMEHVLHNLIDNALNHTPENTFIEVCAVEEAGICIIKVLDNGTGIPNNQIPFLFDKFYRLPQTKTGGTGLGLSIVKGFVEAHGGSINVENNALGGVTFYIKLPVEVSYLNNLKHE
ncbi:MAG TPA: sensor histidine kinase [Chitinophagaceae bacterium]|nr:sensor histidine kinase [Chitinophagaceae bacterium]